MIDPANENKDTVAKEIEELESRLQDARNRQAHQRSATMRYEPTSQITEYSDTVEPVVASVDADILHVLLLMSDSALPLGSFAFSSGLESSIAHNKVNRGAGITHASATPKARFDSFLLLSIQSLASTALPYVLAAHHDPTRLAELDNDFDASTPCTVARRASIAQGKALLSVWERSYRIVHPSAAAHLALQELSGLLRGSNNELFPASGHLPPLWGVVTNAMGLDVHTAAYLFLFSHARTIVSAAVRASVLGPYQAQTELANPILKAHITKVMRQSWDVKIEEAGQSVPAVDIWMGRHELLYSRIFNS